MKITRNYCRVMTSLMGYLQSHLGIRKRDLKENEDKTGVGVTF